MTTTATLFVEQAEYIETDAFDDWVTEHPQEGTILAKLSRGGAKLITGPRGCGKTTLLLKAYRAMREGGKGAALPVYVNYKASLRLEPFYKKQANATYWFNQWLLLKTIEGLLVVAEELLQAKVRPALNHSRVTISGAPHVPGGVSPVQGSGFGRQGGSRGEAVGW